MKGTRKTPARPFKLGEDMIDLRDPGKVVIERMGNRLYVHVKGVTVLRIYGAPDVAVIVNDDSTLAI